MLQSSSVSLDFYRLSDQQHSTWGWMRRPQVWLGDTTYRAFKAPKPSLLNQEKSNIWLLLTTIIIIVLEFVLSPQVIGPEFVREHAPCLLFTIPCMYYATNPCVERHRSKGIILQQQHSSGEEPHKHNCSFGYQDIRINVCFCVSVYTAYISGGGEQRTRLLCLA